MFTLELKAGAGGMLPAARLSFMAAVKGAAALSAVAVSSLDGELAWASYACWNVRSHNAALFIWSPLLPSLCECCFCVLARKIHEDFLVPDRAAGK